MQRNTRTQIIAAFVMVLALGASAALAVALSNSGGRNRLTYADTTVEGQPPQVAAGIAMGAFRGLFVNMLWIRANQLKEDGRYYESMDLAKAITELQPRFPQVWVFHAWNMAYNISVNTQTPDERWRWVSSGIHLLRDEGIPANPNDMLIHKELAWIFLHKIGGYMDDANLVYKKELAAEWTMVLGPPPKPDPRDRSTTSATQKYVDWFKPIADAPDDPHEVVKAEPSVRGLVQRLNDEFGLQPGRQLVEFYTQAKTLSAAADRVLLEQEMSDQERRLMAIVSDPANAPAWNALIPHLRKRMLIDEYHMEPERMLRYTQEFGPLDWRCCATHALYWANRGVENAQLRYTAANKRDFDFVNSGRIVIQSLQELWRTGDVYFDFLGYLKARGDPIARNAVFLRLSPNVHFIDSYGDHLEKYVQMSWADSPQSGGRKRVYSMYAAGYENFRKDAIRFLYRRGEKARALKMKDDLALWEQHNLNDPERIDLFSLPLDDFVRKELEDQLTRPSVAREEVEGALQGAYINGLLARDDELFHEQLDYAKQVHAFYFKEQSHKNSVDVNSPRMGQMDPDFRWVAGPEFAALVARIELEDAETLYDQAPEDLKRFAFDMLRDSYKPAIDELAKHGGRPFSQIFPEPDGMESFRKEFQEKRQKLLERPGVEVK
jgi:hypothetical protein